MRARKTGPELFVGLVGALGTDLHRVTNVLADAFYDMGYQPEVVHVSQLLHAFGRWKHLPRKPLDKHIGEHQKAGNEFRRKTEDGGAMAALAMGRIQEIRKNAGRDADEPLPGTVYLIRSLKHKSEIDLLRRVYGPAFFLVAAYSPLQRRQQDLASWIARSRRSARAEVLPQAVELIQTDEAEDDLFGQRVRDTFPRADAFVAAHRAPELGKQIERFVELLFGHPFHTPSRREFAMFQAFSAALRSADLSRQVGAAIAAPEGDVVALGTNEVPRAGGGAYWEGDPGDSRDFQIGKSSSHEWRQMALEEVMDRLRGLGWLAKPGSLSDEEALAEALDAMDNTVVMNSGEFVRTVHAEMAALLDAARRGVQIKGCTLYSTTFPCHNCAKHIVAAGINSVEYIQPFPKSQAAVLHEDAVLVDTDREESHRVAFQPFVGVAPRRYADLYGMRRRKDDTGSIRRWKWADALPRFQADLYYTYVENRCLADLRNKMKEAGIIEEPEAHPCS